MFTPYDWQEGIGHRAQYVENKLAQGSPVLAVSLPDGILLLTYRRTSRKIFEIYDRLAFAAVGQQSDIESLRVAAVDFAHQEGFNRSEQDVTIQRVVTALSGPVKKAFADFSSAPFVARSLFAEVGTTPEQDTYAVLEYDGDFNTQKSYAFVADSGEAGSTLEARLTEIAEQGQALKKATKALDDLWQSLRDEDQTMAGLEQEAVLLERSGARENRFRAL